MQKEPLVKTQSLQVSLGVCLAVVLSGCGSSGDSGLSSAPGPEIVSGRALDQTATPTESSQPAEPTGGDTLNRSLAAEESGASAGDPVTAEAKALGYVPNEVVIQFRAGVSGRDQANARARTGAQRQELVRGPEGRKGELERARVAPGLSVADAVRALKNDPAVEFAEPNWIYTNSATSADPYYTNGSLWGMRGSTTGNEFGSQADAAWARGNTGANTVYVGVIDEGVFHGHADLAGAVGNPLERPGDRKDNDGNGYRDDHHGWDFVNNNNSVYDDTSDDHGTHVAGTIGARANTGGVVGVSWQVRMISAKFLGPNGGTLTNAVKAIDYFTNLKKKGVNIVATNNSWGGGGYSQAMLDSITRARDVDILFIAAAGNAGTNNDTTPHYPSSYSVAPTSAKPYDNVIAVAALTSTGAKASFSNFGGVSVDLGAPGAAIVSTVPASGNTSGYASWNGTSMATPHVSGAVAVYAASHLGATAAEIRTAILNSATLTPTASLSSTTPVSTKGRLNASGF